MYYFATEKVNGISRYFRVECPLADMSAGDEYMGGQPLPEHRAARLRRVDRLQGATLAGNKPSGEIKN